MSHTPNTRPYTLYPTSNGVVAKLELGPLVVSLEGAESTEQAEAIMAALLHRLASMKNKMPRLKADQTPEELIRRLRA